MILKSERINYGVILFLLAASLVGSLWWALAPPKSTGSPNPPNLQTQTAPQAGPQDPGRKLEGLSTTIEALKSTDVSIVRLMVIGIVLQAFGFLFVFGQVYQLKRGIQGETHSKLYEHYLRVTELLSADKESRSYFYRPLEECASTKDADVKLSQGVEMMCEIILGLLEHAAVQRKNLPPDSWERCWQAYTYERFDRSPHMRQFFLENKKWYAESFLEVVRERVTCRTGGEIPDYWNQFVEKLKP